MWLKTPWICFARDRIYSDLSHQIKRFPKSLIYLTSINTNPSGAQRMRVNQKGETADWMKLSSEEE